MIYNKDYILKKNKLSASYIFEDRDCHDEKKRLKKMELCLYQILEMLREYYTGYKPNAWLFKAQFVAEVKAAHISNLQGLLGHSSSKISEIYTYLHTRSIQ